MQNQQTCTVTNNAANFILICQAWYIMYKGLKFQMLDIGNCTINGNDKWFNR